MRRVLLCAMLLAAPAVAQVINPPSINTSVFATVAQMSAMQATIPTAGTGSPTAVVDANAGAPGAAGVYAPFNHTHPSKARKGIVTTAADGTVTATFSPAFPTGSVPVCQVVAAPTAGTTDVINAQLDGPPTATQAAIRVTRTQKTVVSLIGLTILSIPATVGATPVHYICLEP